MKKINSFQNLILLFAGIVFLTLPFLAFAEAPNVVTNKASSITISSAFLNGEVTDHGSYSHGLYTKSQVWFEYGKTISYGQSTTPKIIEGHNTFSEKLSNLETCSMYHFRAVAENESEKAYGQNISFTTLCNVSSVVNVSVKNISQGDGNWHESVSVSPLDKLSFKIVVESTGMLEAKNIMVKDTLPANIIYSGNLQVGGVVQTTNITVEAINIGNLTPGSSRTITFDAQAGSAGGFGSATNLINSVVAYTEDTASTGSCTLALKAGGSSSNSGTGNSNTGISPTNVNTGITTTILYSFLLPLFAAFTLVWIFKSQIIGIDRIIEKRKKEIETYRAEKKLERMIKKLRK